MPGQTDNSTILAAENQEVVSLNEIVTAINGLKTSLVSSLSSLTIAIKGLQDMVTINNYCGSCGSGSTQTTTCPPCPTSPAAPGDDPSDNQTDPPGTSEEIAVRQCKVAVWLVDTFLRGVASWCDQNNIDYALNIAASAGQQLLTGVALGVAASLITAVITLFVTPGPDITDPFVIILAAVLSEAVAYMATNNLRIDFANLVNFIDDNRSTLICALYNSGNAWTAHSALMVAIDNTSPGLDAANRNFVDKLIGNNDIFLGLLFYVDDRFSLLESWLADQTTTCPCAETEPETGTPTNAYKCKAANYVFDGFVDSLTGWGTVSTMSWYSTPNFISALTNGLLINLLGGIYTVIFSGMVIWATFMTKITSYLGQLFWHGSTYFEAFTAVAAYFTANKAAIICELYAAEDVASAKAALEVHIADYVGSVMTAHSDWSEQEDTYTSVIEALLPTDILNVLFESTARDEITNYAPADFSDCQCGMEDLVHITELATNIFAGELIDGNFYGGECTIRAVNFDFGGQPQYRACLSTVDNVLLKFTWNITGGYNQALEWTDDSGNHYASPPSSVTQPLLAKFIQVRNQSTENNPIYQVRYTYQVP